MPRVLHVITGLTVGGAEMALYRLIVNSRGSAYTHEVAALTTGGVMGQRLRGAGVKLTAFDFKTSPISNFFGLLSLMRKTRPDIVQTWMYHADMFGGIAARLTGHQKIVWGIRVADIDVGDARATLIVRKICAWLSRLVPHTIVCVAEAARRNHIRVGYDAARMIVVPNGFDISQFVATEDQRIGLRAQCGIGTDEVVLGTLGRFNANKDQKNFVHAAGLVARHHKQVRFLMVGRQLDEGNAELMRWIAETGHAERFVLLGERADVPICLAAMDVYCQSSRTEGFPNAVGEAMVMGLPCVVTDVGDSAMLVADTGVVVPKENSSALARGISEVLALTPDARRALGKRARERILAEFTAERVRERFEAIYQRLTVEGKN